GAKVETTDSGATPEDGKAWADSGGWAEPRPISPSGFGSMGNPWTPPSGSRFFRQSFPWFNPPPQVGLAGAGEVSPTYNCMICGRIKKPKNSPRAKLIWCPRMIFYHKPP